MPDNNIALFKKYIRFNADEVDALIEAEVNKLTGSMRKLLERLKEIDDNGNESK